MTTPLPDPPAGTPLVCEGGPLDGQYHRVTSLGFVPLLNAGFTHDVDGQLHDYRRDGWRWVYVGVVNAKEAL